MDFLDKYLSLKYFFVAFCLGMFMVYITMPLPEIIIRYPTPYNAGTIIYKDSADICYVYDARKVNCPKEGVIKTPLQSVNNKIKNNKGAITQLFDKLHGQFKNVRANTTTSSNTSTTSTAPEARHGQRQ
jgi:hypothetical protein